VTKRGALLTEGLAKSTRTRYEAAQQRFWNFCAQCGIQPSPITEWKLQLFIAGRAGRVAANSIRQDVSAINSWKIDHDEPPISLSPTSARILAGAAALDPQPTLLVQLLQRCDADTLEGATLACAFSFAFFGLFRPGELTARAANQPEPSLPRLNDVVIRPSGVSVRLRSSKTSQHAPVWVHV